MHKLLLITLLLFSCRHQPEVDHKTKVSEYRALSVEDSIKALFGIDDSIKLLAARYLPTSNLYAYPGRRIYTFIDFNQNSRFHISQKARFLNREIDTSNINITYWEQRKNMPGNSSEIPAEFKKKWIPLYKYKDEYYVFKDCDFQPVLELNDTSFIVYAQDNYSVAIKSAKQIGNTIKLETFAQLDEDEYYGEYIDISLEDSKNAVYKINYRNYCDFYTTLENLNNFKIIVQECNRDMYIRLVKFDEVDCQD